MPTITTQKPRKKVGKKVGKKSPTKTASKRSKLIPLEDVPFEGIKICIFGKSGSGKTRLAGSFSSAGRVLYMVCSSNGMNEVTSIKGLKNIDVMEIESAEDFVYCLEEARSGKYNTIVLDHVTGFCDRLLAKILGIDKIPEQLNFGASNRNDYQTLGLQVKTFLREMMDIPINCVIIGQERAYGSSSEDEDDIIMPFVSVSATPSIAGWIGPAVDYLCQTFKQSGTMEIDKKVGKKTVKKTVKTSDVDYCLRVGPDEVYMTKFRVAPGKKLPKIIIDPTYDKIIDIIGV